MSSRLFCFNYFTQTQGLVKSWDELDSWLVHHLSDTKNRKKPWTKERKEDFQERLLNITSSSIKRIVMCLMANKLPLEDLKQEGLIVPKNKVEYFWQFIKEYESHLRDQDVVKGETLYIIQDLMGFLNVCAEDSSVLDAMFSWTANFKKELEHNKLLEYFNIFILESLRLDLQIKKEGVFVDRTDFKNKKFTSVKEVEDFILSHRGYCWALQESEDNESRRLKIRPSSAQFISESSRGIFRFRSARWLRQRFWREVLTSTDAPQTVPSLFYDVRASKETILKFVKKWPHFGSGLFVTQIPFDLDILGQGSELPFIYKRIISNSEIEKTIKWAEGSEHRLHWLIFNSLGSVYFKKKVILEIFKTSKGSFNNQEIVKFVNVQSVTKNKRYLIHLLEIYFRRHNHQESLQSLCESLTSCIMLDKEKYWADCVPEILFEPVKDQMKQLIEKKSHRRGEEIRVKIYQTRLNLLRTKGMKSSNGKIKLQSIFN